MIIGGTAGIQCCQPFFFPDSSPKNYALLCFLFPIPNRVKTDGYEIKKYEV